MSAEERLDRIQAKLEEAYELSLQRMAELRAANEELTRWRAMASTPEMCWRELGTRRDTIGRLAKEVAALTAQNHRLVGRIDELKADDSGASLAAANALLGRLGKSIWQSSDLALPHDVKVHNLAAQRGEPFGIKLRPDDMEIFFGLANVDGTSR